MRVNSTFSSYEIAKKEIEKKRRKSEEEELTISIVWNSETTPNYRVISSGY